MFPGADVVASDAMDDFVADVLPHKASLPLLTEEIGDTWIMGACVTGGKKGGKGQRCPPCIPPCIRIPLQAQRTLSASPRLATLFCSRSGPLVLLTLCCVTAGRQVRVQTPRRSRSSGPRVASTPAASRTTAASSAPTTTLGYDSFQLDIILPACLPRPFEGNATEAAACNWSAWLPSHSR